jgi:hypothetical protein
MTEALRNAIAAAAAAILLLATWLGAASAAAAESRQTAREQVGKPVQAAEQLLKQKKYKEALAKLQEADAVANKTPYEVYAIEGTRAAVYFDSGDIPATIKAVDAEVATGILSPAEAQKRVAMLAQLSYQTKDYSGVVAFANRYYRDGGKDPEPKLLTAQAYFLQNDFANAAGASRALIADAGKTGQPPSESVLQMLANCESRLKNDAGYVDALTQLVAIYPKPEYWRDLLTSVRRKPGFANRLALDFDRLTAAAGVMDTADQFMEAAQRALQAGLPGDAKSLLDRGYAAGWLGKGAGADRQQRLLGLASRQASEDMNGLTPLAKEADAAATGLPWVKLGEAYASHGQHDNAIAAFQKGIQKGGLKYPEDAKLHLGVAYLEAKQAAKAKDVLGSVSGADGVEDLARLWLILGSVK